MNRSREVQGGNVAGNNSQNVRYLLNEDSENSCHDDGERKKWSRKDEVWWLENALEGTKDEPYRKKNGGETFRK